MRDRGTSVRTELLAGVTRPIWLLISEGDVPPDVEFGVAAAPWPA